ncbi:MAG: matrixin family metalloprotease [Planctomycetota bacterium]|nr:matrixin family metalloprotease [Planctomycetota bacterium]
MKSNQTNARGCVLVKVLGGAAALAVIAGLAAYKSTSSRELVYTGPMAHAEMVPASIRLGGDDSYLRAWNGPLDREALLAPDRVMPVACFSADQPPSQEVQAAVNAAMRGGMYGGRYFASDRWSIGTQGDPITLTWSFVPDGLSISGGVGEATSNSTLFSTMDTKFAASGGRATWVAQFVACFARYSQLSGLKYTRITAANSSGNADADDGAAWGSPGAATRGECRISLHPIDGANNVLAYCFFPSSGGVGGDMVLDSAENWGSTSNTFRFMRNIITHEHGHGLGLSHVCPTNGTKLMEPFLNTSFDTLRHDDVRGAQRNYGDINEPNDNAAGATNIGAVPVGVSGVSVGTVPSPTITNTSTVGIDGNGDQDWYKFTVAQPSLVTFTAIPAGQTYDNSTQNSNGSCNSGNNINTTAMANLDIRIIGTNGVTTVKLGSTAAAGSNEVLSDILIDAAGPYYAVVVENGTPTENQLYRLTVQALSTTSVTATDNTLTNQVNLSWTTVPGATSYTILRNTSNTETGATTLGSTASTTYSDLTADGGTQYYYFVRATQGDAGSPTRLVGSDAGSAIAPPCPADFNNDGFLDFTDFDAFVAAFEAGAAGGDFNNDGFIDFTDFDAYVAAFEAGC